jgi:hypothetical protein
MMLTIRLLMVSIIRLLQNKQISIEFETRPRLVM